MPILIAALPGIVLLALVLQDAFEVMLLPRRVSRRIRLTRFFFIASWSVWSGVARKLRPSPRREHFLSLFGPLAMVLLFTLWAGGLILSLGEMEWAVQGHSHAPSTLSEQLYMSGVTFFTLGYGDVVPHSEMARAIAVIEAGSGIGFIAVVIGYLPVLYQLFSRREAHVIQLDGRAGSPPTATSMLSRHGEGLGKLNELLREWEVWGSELLESHLSYPMLVYYRSQHDNQSWLAAMAAVMDTCALILVGVEELHPLQARMTFTMARQVLVEMSRSLRVAPARYEEARLAGDAYPRMQAALADAGIEWNGGAQGEETLAALRATYEPLLAGLSARLLLPLPGWIAEDHATDHWRRGHRGLIASRLIEQLSERSGGDAPSGRSSFRGRLRDRLRSG